MPGKKAMLGLKGSIMLLIVAGALTACRGHREVVEIQPEIATDTSLTKVGSIESSLKITALSFPPQPYPYDRIEVDLKDPNLPDRVQHIEAYKLNSAIPLKPHKNYMLTVRAYAGDEVLYSSEYCKNKKTFRSQLGPTLLTISLCEPPDAEDEEAPAGASNESPQPFTAS